MFIGPLFSRELVTAPRRLQHFVFRVAYPLGLYVLMCTAWLVMVGTQNVSSQGDVARFGALLFQVLALLQLGLFTFLAAQAAASGVAQEKDKRTMLLLLMTKLSNHELVLGKMFASLLDVLVMLFAGFPVFMILMLFGGVTFEQVLKVEAVSLMAVLAAGSLGSTVALAREKTFQSLAVTALVLVLWIGGWEAVALLGKNASLLGIPLTTWAVGASPIRAIALAADPFPAVSRGIDGLTLYFILSAAITLLLSVLGIVRLRVWNPGREIFAVAKEEEAPAKLDSAEAARQTHMDARVRKVDQNSRQVWDNPVLWREMCTWAYGRKVLVIRVAYLVLFLMAAAGVYVQSQAGFAAETQSRQSILPPAVQPLAPFFLVSWVIVNALAVTSITNERDGGQLDLLLVTDLTPKEFIFGKMFGVAYVTKEMIAGPLLLCISLWFAGGISLENLVYVLLGQLLMNLFVIMLGIHCGLQYANSRTAIGASLGNVVFLFLGVVTLMLLMIYFSGSFQTQLAPFLAFIVVGGVGLFVTLGARNPSPAIGTASLALPFATFFAVTSFLVDHWLQVFLVTSAAYGFTTLAMLVPAINEFDVALGRSRAANEE